MIKTLLYVIINFQFNNNIITKKLRNGACNELFNFEEIHDKISFNENDIRYYFCILQLYQIKLFKTRISQNTFDYLIINTSFEITKHLMNKYEYNYHGDICNDLFRSEFDLELIEIVKYIIEKKRYKSIETIFEHKIPILQTVLGQLVFIKHINEEYGDIFIHTA